MKFIRDIINEKRSAPQAEPVSDTLQQAAAEETASGALDLGAYLQPEAVPAQDQADSSADLSDEDLYDEAYYDDEYAEEYYEEEPEADAEATGEPADSTEPVTAPADTPSLEDFGEITAEDDPLDRIFSERKQVTPVEAPAPFASSEPEPQAVEPSGAAFFAAADDAPAEEYVHDTLEDEDSQEMATSSPSPSSLADLRRAMASERTAPRLEVTEEMSVADAAPQAPVQMPAPAAGRGNSRSGRVKTRLLGFTPGVEEVSDPMERAQNSGQAQFAVGWVAVVEGPGRGASFTLKDGVSRIGRGLDQTVSLNFGDNSISRKNHVSIAYDSESNQFFIGHSGKANLVRLNNRPLLSTEEIRSGDIIRIGETTLRLVTLCGDDFSWDAPEEKDARYA